MNEKRNLGAVGSSVDSSRLSATIEGVLKLLGGLAIYFGYTTITGDINSVIDQVGALVPMGYAFFGGLTTLYGLFRKIVVTLSAK